MPYMMDEAMVAGLWDRNSDLLRNLKVGRGWVRETALRFNAWIAEMVANGETEGRPLSSGEPWNSLFEHLVWDYERITAFAPSMYELCEYARRLPEMQEPGRWRHFANWLTSDNPAHFRSALAELALHRWISDIGAGIRFNFKPKSQTQRDYTITLPTRVLAAELKSIMPAIGNEEHAAHVIERVYAETFAKKQLAPDGNSVVFVDVSGWHGLAIKMFLSHMIDRQPPKRVSLPAVSARCRPTPELDLGAAPLLLVFLEPNTARVGRVVEVEAPVSAAA